MSLNFGHDPKGRKFDGIFNQKWYDFNLHLPKFESFTKNCHKFEMGKCSKMSVT